VAESGKVELFDEGAARVSPGMRRLVGVMPERAGFYNWMSASDYLGWYAGFYGGARRSIGDLLAAVGLRDMEKRPIAQFSQGMRQRLALARALVHRPRLLILDEPTNGLDPRGRREIHDLLLSLSRDGVGLLLCTHLLDDVDRLCQRIGILTQGRTVVEGTLAELLGRHPEGGTYRLRLEAEPEAGNLPDGMRLEREGGGWWRLHAPPELGAAAVWGSLAACGWRILEIRAGTSGLEDLYLRMTSPDNDPAPREIA
jgi:ABC-2 type transport system ATP-binding protein